jgi:putative membrane protein
MTRWLFATLHLAALGIGLGAVWARGRALRGPLDPAGLKQAFTADAWWGLSAVLWIGTGLTRLFAGMEKSTAYYLENHLFWGKMGLLVVILLLEIAPMAALIRWRKVVGNGGVPDTQHARRYAAVSAVQAAVILLMVVLATGMARGYGNIAVGN